MPTISNIIQQQKNKRRYSIFVDGEFAFGVSEDFLVKHILSVGKQYTAEEYAELLSCVEQDTIVQKTLRFLSYRPRSRKELYEYFNRKITHVPQSVQDDIVSQLEDYGYVDDVAFADWWVQQRRTLGKKLGEYRIIQELRQKGIKEEIIAQCMGDSQDQYSEYGLAQEAAEKIMRSIRTDDLYKTKQKCIQALVRRGFSWDIARQVVFEKFN